jgi:UDP-glucose-4-epimerase GalE
VNAQSILVAGGAGYIGSHTAKLLARRNYQPVVLDNLVTGHRAAARFGPFYHGDIEDAQLIARIAREYDISSAVLFAAHAYVGESVENPGKYYRNNIVQSIALLDALLAVGVRQIVFSSSCSVYGPQTRMPITEDSSLDPLSPYAETKMFVERVLRWYEKAYGLRYVSLRYFNAAGADPEGELGECHDPETHLIPLAILSALDKGTLRVFGDEYPTPDGTCIRDYVHVSDLAEAHVLALEHLQGERGSDTINLGTGTGNSILEVIRMVQQVGGRPVPYRTVSQRPGDAAVLVADREKAFRVLGWKPQLSELKTIVQTAWDWHVHHPTPLGNSQ